MKQMLKTRKFWVIAVGAALVVAGAVVVNKTKVGESLAEAVVDAIEE